MELINGTTRKASKYEPEDYITNMPDIVTTNILDRLPLRDAVRTGILSRNWKLKWTMLSQLVVDDNFFHLLKAQGRDNHVRVITGILLRLKGAITKFDLSIEDIPDAAEDINNLVSLLSRKGVTDLTIENWFASPLELPAHLFSCFELKHLKLRNCYFDPPPTFRGFPNLLSLDLCVEFKKEFELGEFFTRCPLVESLAMDDLFEWDKVKLDGIAKLENLKVLSLRFFDIDDDDGVTNSSTIFELLDSLPTLEKLKLDFEECRLVDDDANKRFFTDFPSIEILELSRICLDNGAKLSFAFDLISCCPNLVTLIISANDWNADSPPEIDCDEMLPLQLQRVVFQCLKGSENELRLIEYLLACSPFLDTFEICFRSALTSDEKLMFTLKLLKFHRASPVVEIDLF